MEPTRQLGSLQTPVGPVTVVANEAAVLRIGWSLDPTGAPGSTPLVQTAIEQLRAYFAGELRVFDLPLDLGQLEPTTAAVLAALQGTVGYGQTVTYGELAARSRTNIPARGVGAIMGANPFPIVIPCHRVLASDGLGGYSGGLPGCGLQTKRWLLELEGTLTPALPY